MTKKPNIVSVNYLIFTALRQLAIDQYEAERLSAGRLAYLLDTDMEELPRVIRVVRATYEALALSGSSIITEEAEMDEYREVIVAIDPAAKEGSDETATVVVEKRGNRFYVRL